MRLLERNKRHFYYANLLGKEPILEDGYMTGEQRLLYTPKTDYRAIVSVATTATNAYVNRRDYGNNESYQLVVICPVKNPFSSTTVFWLDDMEAEAYDYHVIGITNHKNQCFVTIQKVNTG